MTTPKSDEKEELLPCPFCGSKEVWLTRATSGKYLVMCDSCYCHTNFLDIEYDAHRAWNTRVHAEEKVTVADVAAEIFKDSRSMTPEESKATDAFFMSQFSEPSKYEQTISDLRSLLTSQEAVIAVAEYALGTCQENEHGLRTFAPKWIEESLSKIASLKNQNKGVK